MTASAPSLSRPSGSAPPPPIPDGPGEGAVYLHPALTAEHAPRGLPEYHADPPDPACACGAQLMVERHRPGCPEVARIFRGLDPRLSRAEDALQAATTRAVAAWLASGRAL